MRLPWKRQIAGPRSVIQNCCQINKKKKIFKVWWRLLQKQLLAFEISTGTFYQPSPPPSKAEWG